MAWWRSTRDPIRATVDVPWWLGALVVVAVVAIGAVGVVTSLPVVPVVIAAVCVPFGLALWIGPKVATRRPRSN